MNFFNYQFVKTRESTSIYRMTKLENVIKVWKQKEKKIIKSYNETRKKQTNKERKVETKQFKNGM